MLIDTDVVIWAMRGTPSAVKALDLIETPAISAVTVMELVQGTRNKQELAELEKRLAVWGANVLPLDTGISAKATTLVRHYCHSHALRLADALIAATAITQELTLLSGNHKHFQPLASLRFEAFVV